MFIRSSVYLCDFLWTLLFEFQFCQQIEAHFQSFFLQLLFLFRRNTFLITLPNRIFNFPMKLQNHSFSTRKQHRWNTGENDGKDFYEANHACLLSNIYIHSPLVTMNMTTSSEKMRSAEKNWFGNVSWCFSWCENVCWLGIKFTFVYRKMSIWHLWQSFFSEILLIFLKFEKEVLKQEKNSRANSFFQFRR